MEQWLRKEATPKESLYLIIGVLAASLAYSVFLDIAFPGLMERLFRQPKAGLPILSPLTAAIVLITVFLEELMFRFPLAFFRKLPFPVVMAMVAVLSVVFGRVHGSWLNVPIQGVIGVMFSLLFLKLGGLNGSKGKALLLMTAIHFVYDAMALSVNYLSGERMI